VFPKRIGSNAKSVVLMLSLEMIIRL